MNQFSMLDSSNEIYRLALVTPEELAEMDAFCAEREEAAIIAREVEAAGMIPA